MTDLYDDVCALRDRAWQAVVSSDEYKAYVTLKAAVDALPKPASTALNVVTAAPAPALLGRQTAVADALNSAADRRKISQGDAAASALRTNGQPMSAADLLDQARAFGASIGGEKPLVSFTSTLSRDSRFVSVRKAGAYYWWFAGEPLPLAFQAEAEPGQFNDLLGSTSLASSQEGGDGHGPATT